MRQEPCSVSWNTNCRTLRRERSHIGQAVCLADSSKAHRSTTAKTGQAVYHPRQKSAGASVFPLLRWWSGNYRRGLAPPEAEHLYAQGTLLFCLSQTHFAHSTDQRRHIWELHKWGIMSNTCRNGHCCIRSDSGREIPALWLHTAIESVFNARLFFFFICFIPIFGLIESFFCLRTNKDILPDLKL